MTVQPQETKPTILAFGAGRWIWPELGGSPRYHLWSLAARGWRVVYVEPPNTFRLQDEKLWRAPDRDFTVVHPVRVVPFAVRKVGNAWLGEKWRGVTSAEMTHLAKSALAKLGLKPEVIWFGAPWHARLLSDWTSSGALRVAHVYDDLPLSPIYSEAQSRLLWEWEKDLVRQCHLVLCSSKPQLDRRREYNKGCRLLENAVSDDFILARTPSVENPNTPDRRTLELMARLEQTARPRVVYGGVVDHRIDTRHLRSLLNGMDKGSLTLLGVRGEGFDEDFERDLGHDPRLKMPGDTPLFAFPHLYSMADALIIAHKRTPFTDAMLPEKLAEYLSTGRPIVSVRLPEVVRLASESVQPGTITLVDSPEDFPAAVMRAIEQNTPAREAERMRIARRRTWSATAARLEAELFEGLAALRVPGIVKTG